MTELEAATIADRDNDEAEADRRERAAEQTADRRREDGPQLRLRMEDR